MEYIPLPTMRDDEEISEKVRTGAPITDDLSRDQWTIFGDTIGYIPFQRM
jgi:hypothetical protein